MKKTKINPLDYHLMTPDPEPGFNYDHNKAIIDGTIKKYQEMRKKKYKIFQEGLGERNDAIVS